MKVAIITDTHAGVRSDNIFILDYQKQFYDQVFFPYLKANNIRTVFHLGDVVDRRKYINFNTLNRLRTDFLQPLHNACDAVHIIAGNHDTYYKDRNELNALQELLGQFEDQSVFTSSNYYIDPATIFVDDREILLLPWICKENEARSLQAIRDSQAKLCMGHLQLKGFEMHKGSFAEEGLGKDVFEKFFMVLSGHFHHKSTYDNIHYLGCPFQMNWGDYNDSKGFHILDTETLQLTFIPNPYDLFHKLTYDDRKLNFEEIMLCNFPQLTKSYIRVVVKNKDNPFWFDTFLEKLEEAEPLSIQVIEDLGNLAYDGETDDLIHVEDTLTLLSNYCNNIGVNENLKPKLNELLQNLYNEANNQRIA